MKQDKKVISDKLLKYAIKSITENNLNFETDLYDRCSDYFEECYEESFKGKSLPSKQHIVKAILQDANLKDSIQKLANNAAEELKAAFDCAEEESEDWARAEDEEEKEEAERRIKQKKLLDNFSKEQIALLQETFNISI